jgi:hypothetical protein
MDRLEPDFLRYNVELRTAWLVNDAHLTRRRDGWLLTICNRLIQEHRGVLAAAMMLEVVRLDWPGKRFRLRFPLPDDAPEHAARVGREARDYRGPYRRALGRLVTDAFLEQMAREDRPIAYVCEAAGIAPADLEYRVTTWREMRMKVLTFPRLPQAQTYDLDGAIPF